MSRSITIAIMVIFSLMSSFCVAEGSSILLFTSFSMPKASLKGWMRTGAMIHAPLILRGLVNNSFKDTMLKMGELTTDNHGGMQLDPTLFQHYHIESVPAVVVTNNPNCLPNQSCIEEYDVIYGDVTLTYALKKIADQRDSLSPTAETALTELRKNHEI